MEKKDLEQKRVDFNHHTSSVHKPMKYMDFYMRLLSKNKKDFDGAEQAVWNSIVKKNFDWIPLEKTSETDIQNSVEVKNEMFELREGLKPILLGILNLNKDKMISEVNESNTGLKKNLEDALQKDFNLVQLKKELVSEMNTSIAQFKDEIIEAIRQKVQKKQEEIEAKKKEEEKPKEGEQKPAS